MTSSLAATMSYLLVVTNSSLLHYHLMQLSIIYIYHLKLAVAATISRSRTEQRKNRKETKREKMDSNSVTMMADSKGCNAQELT